MSHIVHAYIKNKIEESKKKKNSIPKRISKIATILPSHNTSVDAKQPCKFLSFTR